MSYAARHVDEFLSGMESSGRAMYNRVIEHVRGMDENETGLVSGAYNTTQVDTIAGEILEIFDTASYEARVSKLLASLPKITKDVVEDLNVTLSDTLVAQFQELESQYHYALEGYLEDSAVEYAVMTPYINQLFFYIGSGAQKDAAIAYTQDHLAGALFSYFVTKVTTLVEQYERELYAVVRGNAKKFRYAGPVDERNRDFCSEHVGRVFTAEEIEQWPDEEWSGKIPGTTPDNIWINAGGYNCRHIFEPL